MSEESKPPKKVNLTLHIVNLVAGIVGAAVCLGFVLLAHRIGLKLDGEMPGVGSVQNALILGGAFSAGVSIYSAKKLPGVSQ